jgi:hypothetical protein
MVVHMVLSRRSWSLARYPLFPFLFILGTEVFSRLLQRQFSLGLLKGIKMARSCFPITHILFVDDVTPRFLQSENFDFFTTSSELNIGSKIYFFLNNNSSELTELSQYIKILTSCSDIINTFKIITFVPHATLNNI